MSKISDVLSSLSKLKLTLVVKFELRYFEISDIYCGWPTNLGLLSSLSVVSRGFTVRHPVITKSRPVSEFG